MVYCSAQCSCLYKPVCAWHLTAIKVPSFFLGQSLGQSKFRIATLKRIPGSFSHLGTFSDAVLLPGGSCTSRVAADSVGPLSSAASLGGPKTDPNLGGTIGATDLDKYLGGGGREEEYNR